MSPVAIGFPEPDLGAETGLDDVQWINKVRQELRDFPRWQPDNLPADGVMGALSATSAPFLTSRKPIWDTSAMMVQLNNAGVLTNYVVRDTLAAAVGAGDVYVNRDTGEMIFNTVPAPAGATLAINYQWVKWSDDQILSALKAAFKDLSLKGFFKDHVDVAFQLSYNQFEYELPAWASDPRSRISKVEMKRIDVVTEDWHRYDHWVKLGIDRIRIPDNNAWAPTAKVRITGQGPYTSLGDMEPAVFNVVKWYAKAQLLMDQDAVRMREDTMVATKDEGAQQVGAMANLGSRYMTIYQNAVQKMKRPASKGIRLRPYR